MSDARGANGGGAMKPVQSSLLVGCLAVLTIAGTSKAQEAGDSGRSRAGELQEIVITAQKRPEKWINGGCQIFCV